MSDERYNSILTAEDCNTDVNAETGVLDQSMMNSRQPDNCGETTLLNQSMNGNYYSYGEPQVTSQLGARDQLIRLNTGETFEIQPNAVLNMGRIPTNQICVLNNPSVSGLHAQLISTGAMCMISDNRSTNGTFVNDDRLVPSVMTALNSGDYVTLGNEIFQYWRT